MLSGPNGEQVAAGPEHTPLNKPMSFVAPPHAGKHRNLEMQKRRCLGFCVFVFRRFQSRTRLPSTEEEEASGHGLPGLERGGGLDELHAKAARLGLGRKVVGYAPVRIGDDRQAVLFE